MQHIRTVALVSVACRRASATALLMGILGFATGAASATYLFHYIRNVRTVAPTALRGVFVRSDAYRYELPLQSPVAARVATALNIGSRDSISSDGNAARMARTSLARAFFFSPAFLPERTVLKLAGVDTRRESFQRLSWQNGDRFALWEVIGDPPGLATPAKAMLRLSWVLPAASMTGEQVIEADVVDGVLGVTLTTGMRRIEDGRLAIEGPTNGLRTAVDSVGLVLHGIYAQALARATASALAQNT